MSGTKQYRMFPSNELSTKVEKGTTFRRATNEVSNNNLRHKLFITILTYALHNEWELAKAIKDPLGKRN
jgi:hypothetical protein